MTDKQEAVAEEGTETLTAEEQAFFESEGEKEIEAKEESSAEVQTAEKAETTEEVGEQEGEKEQQARDEKGKFVPHQALHAEREEHKKTRAEMQDLREFKARMEERWKLFEQQGQKQEEEAPPNPDEDIFAYTKWQADRVQKLEAKIAERDQAEQQTVQQQQVEQQIWSHWDQSARSYAQENPDFGDAAKWLSEYRDKQLQALSVADDRFADPKARGQQIDQELKQIVVAAAQRGQNPAQLVHQIAQSWGYAPQQADNGQEQTNGVSEKLQKLEKAQNANRTVGQVSGKGGGVEMTPESLLSMPEHEFNAWMSKPENARRFEKMMGG